MSKVDINISVSSKDGTETSIRIEVLENGSVKVNNCNAVEPAPRMERVPTIQLQQASPECTGPTKPVYEGGEVTFNMLNDINL